MLRRKDILHKLWARWSNSEPPEAFLSDMKLISYPEICKPLINDLKKFGRQRIAQRFGISEDIARRIKNELGENSPE